MRFPSLPDPAREPLWAAIFAGDVAVRCGELLDVLRPWVTPDVARLGDRSSDLPVDVVRIPITVPIDPDGVVVLKPAAVDAERRPAEMEVSRARTGAKYPLFAIGWAFLGGVPMLLPDILDRRDGRLARLDALVVTIAPKGMAVAGFGEGHGVRATQAGHGVRATQAGHGVRATQAGGDRLDLAFDDDTACRVATALLITMGVKLSKAERGELTPLKAEDTRP